jgi:predicted transcriptional regulator
MEQANFIYQPSGDAAGSAAAIAIYADRPDIRGQMEDDISGAGLRIAKCEDIEALLDGEDFPVGDVILLDCPQIDARRMASLARLDMRIAGCAAHLIVCTSMAALDAVFAAFDQSKPQILVDPTRADRIVAVGRVIGNLADARLRELAEEDRMVLLRLTQQVDALARRLEGYESGEDMQARGRLGEDGETFKGFADDASIGGPAVPINLPNPKIVRQIIQDRLARGKYFDPALFSDPAWDMMLDLTAAHAEGSKVAVTSLCIASGVPATTALRWIKQLVETGLFERVEDRTDRRRAFISLSDKAAQLMSRYFAEVIGDRAAVAA